MSDFVWKGKTVDTVGELLNAIVAIDHAEEAAFFLSEYSKTNPDAGANVGYVIGYCGTEERERLYRLFMVGHPVFGGAV